MARPGIDSNAPPRPRLSLTARQRPAFVRIMTGPPPFHPELGDPRVGHPNPNHGPRMTAISSAFSEFTARSVRATQLTFKRQKRPSRRPFKYSKSAPRPIHSSAARPMSHSQKSKQSAVGPPGWVVNSSPDYLPFDGKAGERGRTSRPLVERLHFLQVLHPGLVRHSRRLGLWRRLELLQRHWLSSRRGRIPWPAPTPPRGSAPPGASGGWAVRPSNRSGSSCHPGSGPRTSRSREPLRA